MKQNRKQSEIHQYQSPGAPLSGRRARAGLAAKSVGSFVPRLTLPAFQRFGFPAAAIVTDWEAIAGPELARFTVPERLRWPRAPDHAAGDEFDSGSQSTQRRGATLVLRVDGPRAIEVQFMAGQIIERINVYFGYKAVSELRILQAPLPAHDQERAAKHEKTRPRSPANLPGIDNPKLRQALERLSSHIKSPS